MDAKRHRAETALREETAACVDEPTDDEYDWYTILEECIALGWRHNHVLVSSFPYETARMLAENLRCRVEVTGDNYVFIPHNWKP